MQKLAHDDTCSHMMCRDVLNTFVKMWRDGGGGESVTIGNREFRNMRTENREKTNFASCQRKGITQRGKFSSVVLQIKVKSF